MKVGFEASLVQLVVVRPFAVVLELLQRAGAASPATFYRRS